MKTLKHVSLDNAFDLIGLSQHTNNIPFLLPNKFNIYVQIF